MAPRQSIRFADRPRGAGVPTAFVEVAGTSHTLATPEQHPSPNEVTDLVVEFSGEAYRRCTSWTVDCGS